MSKIPRKPVSSVTEPPSSSRANPSIASRLECSASAWTAAKLDVVLGMSRTTIYEMVAAGDIPFFRLGTKIRFDGVEIAAWWRAKSIPAA